MRFLLDANMPYSSKEVFKKFGQVNHARDVSLLREFLSSLDVKELENAVTIVELGRYRMRR